jgi:hypothetical protein
LAEYTAHQRREAERAELRKVAAMLRAQIPKNAATLAAISDS